MKKEARQGEESVSRTSHDGPYTGNEVDNLGLDAGFGTSPEGGVIGGRRKIDCVKIWLIRLQFLYSIIGV